ncbi:MAG: carboxypeptidase-like regulatory domain-containing protein, partial [Bacteroidetes bacterium]|nr:carboxypeptidase-like regulatory domain-containing protein [Bacteroidota bacterium]
MKYRLTLLFSALFFFTFNTWSQDVYSVSGKVFDKSTHNPLAFVNIVQEDGFGGTTDIDGKFRFRWTKKPRYLALSYVGYESLNFPLTEGLQNLQIEMTAKQIDLKEVEVLPGINPAHRIIRNAIDNRE